MPPGFAQTAMLSPEMRQQMRISPQMRQSFEILQMPLQELHARIRQECCMHSIPSISGIR